MYVNGLNLKLISLDIILILSSISNPRLLWKTITSFLHAIFYTPNLPPNPLLHFLNSLLHTFQSFQSPHKPSLHQFHHSCLFPPNNNPADFFTFAPASLNEISTLLSHFSNAYCDLDPIPTWLLKNILSTIAPIILFIVKLSLSTESFPTRLKSYFFASLLKKPSLDKDTIKLLTHF